MRLLQWPLIVAAVRSPTTQAIEACALVCRLNIRLNIRIVVYTAIYRRLSIYKRCHGLVFREREREDLWGRYPKDGQRSRRKPEEAKKRKQPRSQSYLLSGAPQFRLRSGMFAVLPAGITTRSSRIFSNNSKIIFILSDAPLSLPLLSSLSSAIDVYPISLTSQLTTVRCGGHFY